jgi:large subunit ribosomal protein L6
MSRIGKLPIPIPTGVKVDIAGQTVTVTGPKGTLSRTINSHIAVALEDGKVVLTRNDETLTARSMHGLYRTLVANMVHGVTEGFSKTLEIVGVGYRAAMEGKAVNMALGFSHPVIYNPPDGITLAVDGQGSKVIVSGADKEQVGQVAAIIRRFRVPDHYKGKGVRYLGEYVRIKVGKTGATK